MPSSKLDRNVEKMKFIVLNVVHKMQRFHIKYDENEFMNLNVNNHTLAAVYDWANGKSFSDIMESDTETIHEGQMINIITKDISLLTNFFEINKDMENHSLENKFIQAVKKINKGIVAAKSIYLYTNE